MLLAPEIKIIESRLSILELAEVLGNVSLFCMQWGVPKTQFYEYESIFQTDGIEGIIDLPPVQDSHPATAQTEVEKRVHKRPHQGYRNLGRHPFELSEEYIFERQICPPVSNPPAQTGDKPGTQPQS